MKLKTIMNRLIVAPLDIPQSKIGLWIPDSAKLSQQEFARLRVGRVVERGEGYWDITSTGNFALAPKLIQVGQVVIVTARNFIPFPESMRQKWDLPYVYFCLESDVIAYIVPETEEEKELFKGDFAFTLPDIWETLNDILTENAKASEGK